MGRERAAGGRRSLSEGMLVEARIVARLMGLRLLTVDAAVALLPAAAKRRMSSVDHESSDDYRQIAARGPKGTLGDAVRRLDEGTQVLERVRRNSLTHRRSGPS
jgi:hypothetical protein